MGPGWRKGSALMVAVRLRFRMCWAWAYRRPPDGLRACNKPLPHHRRRPPPSSLPNNQPSSAYALGPPRFHKRRHTDPGSQCLRRPHFPPRQSAGAPCHRYVGACSYESMPGTQNVLEQGPLAGINAIGLQTRARPQLIHQAKQSRNVIFLGSHRVSGSNTGDYHQDRQEAENRMRS